MKQKNTILLFGTGSIIILITIQVYLIWSIWTQKNEMFDLRYKSLSQDLISRLSRFNNNAGFDTAYVLINSYAGEAMKKEFLSKKSIGEKDLNTLKKQVLEDVSKILVLEQDLSSFLSNYFASQGYEKDFNFKIEINYLQLIDFDTKVEIYANPDFMPGRRIRPGSAKDQSHIQKSRILVNSYWSEMNNFRMQFDYYIDFRDKKQMVAKEISASLFLRTPLSTITVAGKTLEMDMIRTDPGKIMETARLIGKQSIHLNQLINLILEISMWERTQFQLDKKQVEVEELIKDIVESFRSGCSNCVRISFVLF